MESTFQVNSLNKRVVGVVGSLHWDALQYCLLAASCALAWAYCFELTLLTFYTFRRWSGLYFYSILISAWGCTFHALGFLLKFMTNATPGSFLPFIEIGWVAMVTGQSFVLYSRLHLVVRQKRTLHLILSMILTNAIVLHIPTIVLTIGSNLPTGSTYAPIFNVMERIQLAIFCVQEFVISTVYIYCTVRLLRGIFHSKTRKVMYQLIAINSVCLGMDVVLIGLEYSNNYVGETSVKAMIYAIKLKLEFAVLNQLMSLTQAGLTEHGSTWRGGDDATLTDSSHGGNSKGHSSKRRNVFSETNREQGPHLGMSAWSTTRVFRGSFHKNDAKSRHMRNLENIDRAAHQRLKNDQISREQEIEVVSEPKSNFLQHGKASDEALVDSAVSRAYNSHAVDFHEPHGVLNNPVYMVPTRGNNDMLKSSRQHATKSAIIGWPHTRNQQSSMKGGGDGSSHVHQETRLGSLFGKAIKEKVTRKPDVHVCE